MKYFLLFCVCFISLISLLEAQTISAPGQMKLPSQAIPLDVSASMGPGHFDRSRFAMPPTEIFIAYFDTANPIQWRIPTNYGDFTSLNISQRFTLPTSTGFIDSIWVLLTELPLGEMRFDVVEDTLVTRVQADSRLFHYPNYWAGARAQLDTVRLKSTDAKTGFFNTMKFNHAPVKQNFHIIALPTNTGGVSSLFALLTDSKQGDISTIDPDTARTIMLVNYMGQAVPIFMHGMFTDHNNKSLAPDIYMIAFVQVDLADGSEQIAIPSRATLAQSYPNPARSREAFITIPFEIKQAGFTTLEVFDAMGRKLSTLVQQQLAPGSYSEQFPIAGVRSGMYMYRLMSGTTVRTGRLVVN